MEAIEGRWFGELKKASESFVASTSERISGTITYQLNLRGAYVCSIKADSPLYIRDRDSWEKDIAFVRSRRSIASAQETEVTTTSELSGVSR